MPEYEVIFEQKVPSIVASIKNAIGNKYDDVETSMDEILVVKAKRRLTATEREAIEAILGRKLKEI